jgi:hypothetical protein
MEREIDKNSEKLFDLIESKNWNQLSDEEMQFVLLHITEDEFHFQRQILVEADDIFDENSDPKPLLLPTKKVTPIFAIRIPLYQTILAVAATVLVFLMLWPNNQEIEQPIIRSVAQQKQEIKTNFVHDTVVKYITLTQIAERVVYDTITAVVQSNFKSEEPRLFQANNNLPILDLSPEKLEVRGSSLKEENTIDLLPKMVNTIY